MKNRNKKKTNQVRRREEGTEQIDLRKLKEQSDLRTLKEAEPFEKR
jgi:hypothetical protein